MGKLVNVVLPNGKVVSVDEDVASTLVKANSGRVETGAEEAEAGRQASNKEKTGAVQAGLVSGINTALAGVPGLIGLSESNREAVKQHPSGALVGDIAAIAAPTGLLGKAAKEVTAGTVIGQASKLGQMGTAGRVGEGIILGGGGHVAKASISGDSITVEGLAADIGIAALLNVGIGAAADRFSKMVKRSGVSTADDLLLGAKPHVKGDAPLAKAARARMAAEEAQAAAREAKDEATRSMLRQKAEENVAAAKSAMDDDPVYANFRDTYNSAQDTVVAANKTVASEANKFAEFASQAGAKKTLSTYEKAANKLRTELAKVQAEVDAAVKADTKAAGTSKQVSFTQANKVKPVEKVSLNIDDNRIDKLNKALSEVTKLKDITKTALKDDNFEMLHTYMGGAHQRVEEALAAATKPGFESSISVKLPEIPKYPGQTAPVAARLPDKLTDIGKMHTDTIANIANAMDDAAAAETINLARSLGLEAETAADALVGIHQLTKEAFHLPIPGATKLSAEAKAAQRAAEKADELTTKSKFQDAADEVDRAREVTGGRLEWGFSDGNLKVGVRTPGSKGSLLGHAKDWTRSGVISAAGRAADIGGWKGAMLRRLGYGAAGYALDGIDGAFLGVAAGSARAGLLGGIRETVARAAAKVGPGLNGVRPLTAYLGARGGRSADKTLYDGEGAKALMDEVYTTVQSAPDATYELMKGFMGQAGDLAFQLHSKVMNGLQYLADTAPKDPGIDVTASGSNWTPDAHQVNEWLHRYEATLEPMEYVKRIFSGDGHRAGVEALAWNWPAILSETQTEAMMKNWQDMTESQNNALSILFQRPMTAAQNPDVVATIQGMYLQSMNQPQPKQDSRNTGGPPGRPAAVQSPVAGSNVSQLIA